MCSLSILYFELLCALESNHPCYCICISLIMMLHLVWCISVIWTWGGELNFVMLFLWVRKGPFPKLGEILLSSHIEKKLQLHDLNMKHLRTGYFYLQIFLHFKKGKQYRFCTFLTPSAETVVLPNYETIIV